MSSLSLISKKTKMSDLINFRIKVTTLDGRQFIGKLLSFDKHMNLVISECEEFRITKKSMAFLSKQSKTNSGGKIDESSIVEDKRFLGLIILRGENVISLSVEGGLMSKPLIQKTGNIIPKGTSKILASSGGGGGGNNALLSGGSAPRTNVRKFNPPPGFKR